MEQRSHLGQNTTVNSALAMVFPQTETMETLYRCWNPVAYPQAHAVANHVSNVRANAARLWGLGTMLVYRR